MQNLSEKLMTCGMRRSLALVIEVLSDNEWHLFRDIERKADLRQPEVSGAIKEIAEYLTIKREIKHGVGAPIKEVMMAKPTMKIFIQTVITKKEIEIREISDSLEELKKI